MTDKRRIVLNVIATYGRSLCGMLLGLFSSRWVLASLGVTDFGVYGLVGSLLTFLTIISSVMDSSIGRFYAYAIGDDLRHKNTNSESVTKWFNLAVSIYLLIGGLVVLIGYPLCDYAIKNWLVIPGDRLAACIIVLRLVMIGTFLSIVTTPFRALFLAHQNILEVSLLSLVVTLLNFVMAYSIRYVHMDKLVYYSFYMLAINAWLPLVLVFWAPHKYSSCRLRFSYWYKRSLLKEFFGFSGWQLFGLGSALIRNQGGQVVINLNFGAAINGAYNVANQLSAHSQSLARSLIGAFSPSITTSEGEGSRDLMLRRAYQSSRYSTLFFLVFAIPLSWEVEMVLRLWLVNPPAYTASLCVCMLCSQVLNNMCVGNMIAISAQGRIALYQSVVGILMLLTIPFSILLVRWGVGPVSVGLAIIVCEVICDIFRVYICKRQLNMEISGFLRFVLIPFLVVVMASSAVCLFVRMTMTPSCLRVIISSAGSLIAMSAVLWFFLFSNNEKVFFKNILQRILIRRSR